MRQPGVILHLYLRPQFTQPRRQPDRVARADRIIRCGGDEQQRRRIGSGVADGLRFFWPGPLAHRIDRTARGERIEVVRSGQAHACPHDRGIHPLRAQPLRVERQHHRGIGPGGMPREGYPRRIAAKARRVVTGPAHRFGAILQKGGKAHRRHFAIIGDHHQIARTGKGASGEGIGGAVALHPAPAIPPDQHRARGRGGGGIGRPDIQRLALRTEGHRASHALCAAPAPCHPVQQG